MLTGARRLVRRAGAVGAAAGLAGALTFAAAPSAGAAASDEIRGSQQWVFTMLDVYPAWQQTEGAGVTVAVLDSGVNPDVSDLAGSVSTGPDLTGLHTPPSNPEWGVHGTWMASLIAGHGHDGGQDGILGVAPQSKIISIRVIPEKGDPGYHIYDTELEQRIQQSLATGIKDAVNDGAKVISMSLGYTAPSAVVRTAVLYAFDHGVVLVASSGNSGQDDVSSDDGFAPVSFPAEYPGVLGVAALNQNGSVADFSSNNLSVQVAAPGYDVPAQGRDGGYWLVSGTSPACALVAGVAALIKSKYPGLAPDLVLEAITSTAHGGYNPRTGFGAVDAGAALAAAGHLATQHPSGSQAAVSVQFGGGPAAVPPPPVASRGAGQLVLFSVLALALLAAVIASSIWLYVLRRARREAQYAAMAAGGYGGAHAAYFGSPYGQSPLYGQPSTYGQPAAPGQPEGSADGTGDHD